VQAELDELHFCSEPSLFCKRAVNKNTSDHFSFEFLSCSSIYLEI
jgi:hypothetical protein